MERTRLKPGKGAQIYCEAVTWGERAVANRNLENVQLTWPGQRGKGWFNS